MATQLLERLTTPKTPTKTTKPAAGTVTWFNECVERGKGGIFSETITLTPGLAGELLRRNPDNRNLRKTKVAQITADILAGHFALNGHAIKISKEGLLNDGQHRLASVVEANRPIQTVVTFGVERDTRTTLDQGAGRTASDYLAMDGVTNASVQASLTRQLLAFERSKEQSLSDACYVTNAEVLERIERDPGIARAATFAATHAKAARKFVAPAIIGFCYYLFRDINPVEADAYMKQVCDGEGLLKRDPAYAVRDRLLTMSKGRQGKAHVIFRGWNAYRTGRGLDTAKIVGDNLPALV